MGDEESAAVRGNSHVQFRNSRTFQEADRISGPGLYAQNLSCRFNIDFACGSGVKSFSLGEKKLHAGLMFQFSNVFAERGLGDAQLFGRLRQASCGGDG